MIVAAAVVERAESSLPPELSSIHHTDSSETPSVEED